MPEPDDTAAGAGSAPAARVRVVLADDSVLFRDGLARLLADNGVVVAAQAGDAPDRVGEFGDVGDAVCE